MTTPESAPTYDGLAEVGVAPEPVALEYHEVLRGGRWGDRGWWRVLVGVPSALLAVLVVQSAPVAVWTVVLLAQGRSSDDVSEVADGGTVTPAFLAVVNLGWALTIPVVLLAVWVMHRLTPGWVASVAGRIRWRFLFACFGLSLVALFANLAVASVLPAQSGDSIAGSLNDFTAETRNFALVIVLLTPLQAAGEEYAFRGYLTQAFGGLLAGLGPWVSRGVAVVVPALLFATAHGLGQGWPIFTDRLAFGVVAGILVIATGGLEAGIALHVLNNFLAFGIALAFGDMTSALNATGGTWWSLPSTLTQALVYTALCIWLARRMGLATRTTPVVLAAPHARV